MFNPSAPSRPPGSSTFGAGGRPVTLSPTMQLEADHWRKAAEARANPQPHVTPGINLPPTFGPGMPTHAGGHPVPPGMMPGTPTGIQPQMAPQQPRMPMQAPMQRPNMRMALANALRRPMPMGGPAY